MLESAKTGDKDPTEIKGPRMGSGAKLGWLLLLFVLILNLPNFIWLEYATTPGLDLIEYGERLLLGMLLGAIFLSLFAKPSVAWLALWVLCLWWQPLALAVRFISGTPITQTLVGMAAATNPSELRNLMSVIPWAWVASFLLWNVGCLLVTYWLWRRSRQWRWSWGFRGKVIFFSVAMLLLPHLVLQQWQGSPETSGGSQQGRYKAGHPLYEFEQADRVVGSVARLPETFPYELPWAAAQYWQGRRVIDRLRANLQEPAMEFTLADTTPQVDVMVLVIGESSTRNAWRWFNPHAPDTTPRLEARLGRGEFLFGFRRALAQTRSTSRAVPSMLTNQPLVWPDGSPNPMATRSIVSVAADAGFSTAWFSNQASVGRYDGIIATYAHEASSLVFMNPGGYADKGSIDGVMLPAVKKYLAEHHRAFVVLHTMGSHFHYNYRYPKGFGPFPDPESAREEYFNTIAYTDYVLDQVIGVLADDGRRSVVIYASDHGEAVPGGECNAGVANRNTRDGFEIPVLVWLSDEYAEANPEVPMLLQENQDEPYSNAALPQTMLDLMRGSAQSVLSESNIYSLLRPIRQFSGEGQGSALLWEWRFQIGVKRNPCFVLPPD